MQVILTEQEYKDLLHYKELLYKQNQRTNVALPDEFVATKYPGYFFNTITKTLFSIKISGTLHELKKAKPNMYNRYLVGYTVSVKGQNRKLPMAELMELVPEASVIPVEGEVWWKPNAEIRILAAGE